VVSPATTSVLRFVPRSENLKKVPKVSLSPLPAYVRDKYSISALQHAARLRRTACQHFSLSASQLPRAQALADWLTSRLQGGVLTSEIRKALAC
jgi:hypothetical protein